MRVSQLAAVGSIFAAPALAWNTDVHQQIAYAAEEFLTPLTRTVLLRLLEPEYKGSLGRVGAWADAYRKTPEGAYTETWHYIDPADNPPAYCNVYPNRDNSLKGSIVSALTNQTQILKGCVARAKAGKIRHGEDQTCANAVKFVTHFTMDVAQPLHVSGIAAGGNFFPVTFNGAKTNLHAIWDGAIIYQLAGVTRFNNDTLQPFFETIVSRIKKDNFFVPVSDWLSCVDPGRPSGCALAWARDTNEWTCDYVYSQMFNGTDVATSGYAEGAYPIVEVQAAKAVLRMATWFNRLVDGLYHDREVITRLNPSWVGGPAGGA
ncbi:nuclease P1 [Xylariaceae sp. FL0594]|nr:nuclease P1 [Xylariaceae sp. FL0594]